MTPDIKYWVGFNLVPGIGPAKLLAMLNRFGSAESCWQAQPKPMRDLGIDERSIDNLQTARKTIDLDREMEKIERANVGVLCWESADYPPILKSLTNAPPLLYIRGEFSAKDEIAVALVGTRRISTYGRLVTEQFTADLVRQGMTIVSGLAKGIDTVAHKTAIECGGRTIAVLGAGIDCIYPTENRGLVEAIIDGHGAVVSEYPLGTQPESKNFPPRNRIISGLSLGTVVIEAGEKSGALITARFAEEHGRRVMAVPGDITKAGSKGTNELIKSGALMVTSAQDVLEELEIGRNIEYRAAQLILPESAEEAELLPLLSQEPIHLDELTRQSGLTTPLVSSTLTLLELKGVVRQVGGMNFILNH